MTDIIVDKLISLFWDGLGDMSWDDWCCMGSYDREAIVADALAEIDDITLDTDEVYDLFWEWADGLDRSSFDNIDSESEDDEYDEDDDTMTNTNHIIVVDFNSKNNYLEDQYLLGWNDNYNYWDTENTGDDIIEVDGNAIKQNSHGLIKTGRWPVIYASDNDISELTNIADNAKYEGYNCTVCKIDKDSEGLWIVVPV